MAADPWARYNSGQLKVENSTIDLDADVIKVALFTSAYTPAATDTTYASISANEVANANGYTTGGITVTTTVTEAAGVVTFDSNDPTWTAAGGSITARYAVLYDSTTGDLLAYSLLDNTPADVTVTDTNTLTLQLATTGYWQRT